MDTYAPIISHPLGGTPGKGGNFVKDPVKVLNFHSLMVAQSNHCQELPLMEGYHTEEHAGLKITDSRSPVMMTSQKFFSLDKPRFWPVK